MNRLAIEIARYLHGTWYTVAPALSSVQLPVTVADTGTVAVSVTAITGEHI